MNFIIQMLQFVLVLCVLLYYVCSGYLFLFTPFDAENLVGMAPVFLLRFVLYFYFILSQYT